VRTCMSASMHVRTDKGYRVDMMYVRTYGDPCAKVISTRGAWYGCEVLVAIYVYRTWFGLARTYIRTYVYISL
jgi:hypothetical protein